MPPAPVAQVLPLAGRLTQAVQLSLVLPEARHQPAAGATAATCLVGLRRSLVRCAISGKPWYRVAHMARRGPNAPIGWLQHDHDWSGAAQGAFTHRSARTAPTVLRLLVGVGLEPSTR